MTKKQKKLLKDVLTLTCADYMCNTIKLNIYSKEEIFNTKNLKIEFRNKDTNELIHTIYLSAQKTIKEELN